MLRNIIAVLDKAHFEAVVVCPIGDVVHQFEEAGARVLIAPRPMYQFQHMSGYEKSIFHPRFLYGAYMQLKNRTFWKDFIRESGADIVHINAVTLAPMAWSAKEAGARVICLVQETAVHGLFGLRLKWLRYILSKWVDAVVYISEYDKQEWGGKAPIVEVIPNWVDFKNLDKTISQFDSRQAMDLPGNAKIIVFMGGIDQIKGTLPLLKALTLLSDIENLLLVIAGYNEQLDTSVLPALRRIYIKIRHLFSADYNKKVCEFVKKHKLKNRVRFIGMTDKVALLYAASDVVVFPAVSPHQARPVLEAGAMSKVVIVSDFKNLQEFVKNDQTGLLVPPNDAVALAKALRRILDDPVLAARLGDGNFRMAYAKHNLAINGKKFAKLYEKLTAGQAEEVIPEN